MRTVLIIVLVLVAAVMTAVRRLKQCPASANVHIATGWREYRNGRTPAAERAFRTALTRCPRAREADVGLGYIALQELDYEAARQRFRYALDEDSMQLDALIGLGLVQWREAQLDSARITFERALVVEPERAEVLTYVAQLPPLIQTRNRVPLVLPDTVQHHVRVQGEYFEVRIAGGWQRFYINGVNLGAALPGRYPSEFPDAATYAAWIRDIAAMGANTVRVYTLHPPAFYDALAAHNAAHPERPLWLLHGIWAELPPRDDYDDATWLANFEREMEAIVDAVHGRADVAPRAGHAAGAYTADVSPWTLGFIVGREWEPFSVAEFNERNPAADSWRGRYLGIGESSAMDAWLTRVLDHIIGYETETYRTQRPVAYTNWPTLDPMRHPTELDAATERPLRGLAYDSTRRAHNEDEVELGGVPMHATAAFPAGWFAAYHIYPYYPDFFLHDPDYARATSPFGPSAYYGYLRDLKQHLPGVPLVVAEYGIPASWGISHFNPQGWHHGGHGEAEMAAIDARLTREIAAAGMAGGILFSWMDEWFKQSWLDLPFEAQGDRARLWWNRMNPEQHYGVLAMEPERRLGATLAERTQAWSRIRPLYATRDGLRLRAHADEAYLWLQLSGPIARAERLLVGFDVGTPLQGDTRLPGAGAPAVPAGLEFVMEIDAAEVRLRAAPPAQQFRIVDLPRGALLRDRRARLAAAPRSVFSGSFIQLLGEPFGAGLYRTGEYGPLRVAVNPARGSADSTNWLGFGYDRGVLPPGPLPDGAWERSSAGDVIEVRIPWILINVTDPSRRRVVYEEPGEEPDGVPGTRVVAGIGLVLAVEGEPGGWRVWPVTGRPVDVAQFTWPTWEEPRYRARRRPVFEAMRAVFAELDEGNLTGVTTP